MKWKSIDDSFIIQVTKIQYLINDFYTYIYLQKNGFGFFWDRKIFIWAELFDYLLFHPFPTVVYDYYI